MAMTKDEAQWLMQSLREIKFFSKFTIESVDSILKRFNKNIYPVGKTIIKEGTPGLAFHVIYKGSVDVYKKKLFVFKSKIAELNPGSFFGEMSLISNTTTTASIVAMEYTEVFTLLKSKFQDVVQSNPEVADEIRYVAAMRNFEVLNR